MLMNVSCVYDVSESVGVWREGVAHVRQETRVHT